MISKIRSIVNVVNLSFYIYLFIHHSLLGS